MKSLLCTLLLLLSVLPVSATFAGDASVFVYHRFGDDRYPSTNIAIEVFADQLAWLQQQDYTVLTLGEIVARLERGAALPARCAALTVDDAYRTFLTGAMPLLRRYRYPATLFVSTDAVGGEGYLSWDELRALQREGIEIGNHSAAHPYFLDGTGAGTDAAWATAVRGDIGAAQARLEQELGRSPQLFAYPYGEYSPALAALVKALGFRGAAAQQSGVVADGSDRFSLPRFPMGGGYASLEGFREKLSLRALPVVVLAPAGPVVAANPPLLTVEIDGMDVDLEQLRCFVPGQEICTIVSDGESDGRYRVQAGAPLSGRRSKYTLTAPSKRDGRWYWFSQLWVLPR